MAAPSQDQLPTALAARISEGQLQQLVETPRPQRLAALARVLALDEADTLAELGRATGLDVVSDPLVARADLPILPARLAHDYQVIALTLPDRPSAGELHLASTWPPDRRIEQWIATFTPRHVRWHLANSARVHQLIVENYGVGAGSLDDEDAPEASAMAAAELDADADAAVVRFVTDIINQAITDGATDIHFEPQEGQLSIRYRVDGLLVPVPVPENILRYQDAIISRLKIMARLNISEKRLPQDGRINFKTGGDALDIRVSTIPTIYAESVSLRLLNNRNEAYTMELLGLTASEQARIVRVLDYPHGLILVTGPTGSGKSTSLNAFLRRINSPELRIVTIEDPIEYEVPGANQMQIRPEIGLTFAGALRHILRQDPDVIMVGEIRDRETADIAIRASLTGHLVFSTLHTNDAPGAITRLVDMGIEPFLVASAVELVIAQRLMRRLCPDCIHDTSVDPVGLRKTLAALGLDPAAAADITRLPAAAGCRQCRGSGYRGRVGIFEILQPDDLHDLIVRRESTRTLARAAREHGFRTLQQAGWEKVRGGVTTLDELLRVINVSDS